MMRPATFLALFVLFALPLAAQEPPVVFEDLRIGWKEPCQQRFGWSVAVEGDVLLVGCSENIPGTDVHPPGSVFAYHRQPGEAEDWSLEAVIESPPEAVAFGYRVRLAPMPEGHEGEMLALVTAQGNDAASVPGRAYTYRREADMRGGFTWVLEAELDPPDGVSVGWYGRDAALAVTPAGEALALVAAQFSPGGGAVVVFHRESGRSGEASWSNEAVLQAAEVGFGDSFGRAVDFDGTRAVISAPAFGRTATTPETWLGAAWIFGRTGGGASAVWHQEARLIPDEPPEAYRGSRYGASVAIDGEWAVVGAPFGGEQPGSSNPPGEAYMFRWEPGPAWTPVQKLENEDGFNVLRYGSSLAMRGGRLLVGVLQQQSHSGSVRVWLRLWPGEWAEKAKLVASEGGLGVNFGYAVADDGYRAVVGSPNRLSVYLYGPASLPVASEPSPHLAHAVLSAPYPHPFSARTALVLELQRAELVEAVLYDVLGRPVAEVFRGVLPEGAHGLVVDGEQLTPGPYFLMVAGETFRVSRMLLRVR